MKVKASGTFMILSTAPLRITSILGVAGTLITAIYMIMTLLRALVYGSDVPEYPSLFLAAANLKIIIKNSGDNPYETDNEEGDCKLTE